tara:strand:- start:301 stop:3090 length:2790 start_codon:yes stop_codon:yes gene_type:complete
VIETQVDTGIEKNMFKRYEARLLVLVVVPVVMLTVIPVYAQTPAAEAVIKLKAESSEDAQDVYADGASYQNGGKFEIAIEEWLKFRDTYSDDPLAPKSIYYLGICSLQLQKYDDAAAAFEFTATRYEKHENSETAYFYWGRTRYAQALGAKDAEKRNAQLSTAISAFSKQLELFEKGQLSDQALYLRGESFYNQNEKTKAIADYRAVVTGFPQSGYRQDAIYVLGATLEEQEKYKEAGVAYDVFLKEFPESELRTEVRMRKAETMLQQDKFKEAAQIFAEVAAVEGFPHATRSRLRQALCLVNLEQFDDASTIYHSVLEATEDADHKKTAVTQLNVLCRKYIDKELFDKSLALAQQMVDKADTVDLKVRFKMAAADSLDGQAKYNESRSRYLAIVNDHAEHVLAPDALYFAAFAAFKLKQYDDVFSDSSVFGEKYGEHEFAKDVTKLLEEARVLKSVDLFKAEKFAETIEILMAVVKDNPKGNRAAESLLLLARSQARLEKHDQAKVSIAQLIEGFPESNLLPEATYRLGEYHFVGSDYDVAITHFTSVIEKYADSTYAKDAVARRADVKFEKGRNQLADKQVDQAIATWKSILDELEDYRLAHAVLYEVAFALRSLDKHDEARAVFTQLVSKHAESDLAADSFFRLGEYEYDDKDYTKALEQYAKAFARSQDGDLQELILHKLGWASFRNNAFETSGKHFAQQVQKYAQGELANDGKFMHAESLFKQDKYAEALVVFEPIVDSKFDSEQFSVLVWLHAGQSAAQTKKFEQARGLLQRVVNSELEEADSYRHESHFEIGWSYDREMKYEEALKSFEAAGRNRAGVGARAFFMIGDVYFKQKKFSEAIKQFDRTLLRFETDDAKPWQALSAYEAGRCKEVLAAEAEDPEVKKELIRQAIDYYQQIVDVYSETEHVVMAKSRIEELMKVLQ